MTWVEVESVDYDGRGTVATGTGWTADGRYVTFAGEPRNLAQIAAALDAGEPVLVQVPPWAILGAAPEPVA